MVIMTMRFYQSFERRTQQTGSWITAVLRQLYSFLCGTALQNTLLGRRDGFQQRLRPERDSRLKFLQGHGAFHNADQWAIHCVSTFGNTKVAHVHDTYPRTNVHGL